ncbi:MAG: T9SS type A sorting domain-containing protein [Paludibacter sp.]
MIEFEGDYQQQVVSVYNTVGQKLNETRSNNSTCFIPVPESGVYLVNITNNKSFYTQKVFVR